MPHISNILAAITLFGMALSAPPDIQARTPASGPPADWIPVKLIDIHPGALYEGLPANDSVIDHWEPPTTQQAKHIIKEKRGLEKRALSCYSGGEVFADQLRHGANTFCDGARDAGISNGGEFAQWRSTWWNGDIGAFVPFIKSSNGKSTAVFYSFKVNNGFVFNRQVCIDAYTRVAFDCQKGSGSGGGVWHGFNNGQVDANLDPD